MLTLDDFCPALDQNTLLQFRDDAYHAWMMAPQEQEEFWQRDYALVCQLLETAKLGHVRLA